MLVDPRVRRVLSAKIEPLGKRGVSTDAPQTLKRARTDQQTHSDITMAEPAVEIDDNLYSRQRYVLGDEAMKKMVKSSVFLSGLGGLGVEIGTHHTLLPSLSNSLSQLAAKNVALAGVRLLNLNDHENATFLDLGTQFYLSASDVGKSRVEVTTPVRRCAPETVLVY